VSKLGGILLRAEKALLFVPASEAVKLAPIPHVTRVPGAAEGLIGVALHEGEILPVVSIGPERQSMLICACAGALLGIVGASVVETGMFDATPDGESVRRGDETATRLDIAALSAKAGQEAWGGRWLT
jgi:hypothetical protein